MRHIISILIENEAGALSRVAGLFSARGYNIESLTVAPTEDASLSRMTLVTRGSEDIIEQIIGDIEDEFDIDEEAYIKTHGDDHYIIKAHTPIDEFNEQLQANFSDESYDTIGGIVMTNFGYLPKRGEVITIDKFQFKIINADARHIKLLECFDLRPNQPGTCHGNTGE